MDQKMGETKIDREDAPLYFVPLGYRLCDTCHVARLERSFFAGQSKTCSICLEKKSATKPETEKPAMPAEHIHDENCGHNHAEPLAQRVANEVTKTKWCGRCKKDLPRSAFNNNAFQRDGLQQWCRECSKEYKNALPKRKKKEAEPARSVRTEIPVSSRWRRKFTGPEHADHTKHHPLTPNTRVCQKCGERKDKETGFFYSKFLKDHERTCRVCRSKRSMHLDRLKKNKELRHKLADKVSLAAEATLALPPHQEAKPGMFKRFFTWLANL